MKTPWYETSAGATVALLVTKTFSKCNLYTFTLVDGTILRYAAADMNVAFGGNTWLAHTVDFDVLGNNSFQASWKGGTGVGTWQTDVRPRAIDVASGTLNPDQIEGTPFMQALRAGAFDKAVVQVDRAVWAVMPLAGQGPLVIAPVGVFTVFAGHVAAIDMQRNGAIITINDFRDLFSISFPRRVFQSGCRNTLFDADCSLVKASYAVAGSALIGSTNSVIQTSIAAPAGSATYSLGTIKMTSGKNVGLSRTIRTWTPGTSFLLLAPFYYAIQTGDTFNAYPGCDKQLSTCQAFSNQANFEGEPFTPPPETAI